MDPYFTTEFDLIVELLDERDPFGRRNAFPKR